MRSSFSVTLPPSLGSALEARPGLKRIIACLAIVHLSYFLLMALTSSMEQFELCGKLFPSLALPNVIFFLAGFVLLLNLVSQRADAAVGKGTAGLEKLLPFECGIASRLIVPKFEILFYLAGLLWFSLIPSLRCSFRLSSWPSPLSRCLPLRPASSGRLGC